LSNGNQFHNIKSKGRGRTTSGMIITTLYLNSINELEFIKEKINSEKIEIIDEKEKLYNDETEIKNNLRNGNYKLINRLLRVLSNGESNKRIVDIVIDENSTLQNLRTAILDFKEQYLNENLSEEKKKLGLERSISYLQRYFLFIVFNEYLSDKFTKKSSNVTSFNDWVSKRNEILTLFNESNNISNLD
jgi:hypothetical protein